MTTHLIVFKNTSIVLGSGLSRSSLLEKACQMRSIVLLADDQVAKLHGETIKDYLQKANKDIFLLTFPAGESSKSRETKALIEDQMFSKGLSRDTLLIGLGGGVTTDLAGYIASTYCRGIPLVLMPTSLLAMVDASLGGKTGINTPYGKNLLGTFYLPETLIIDFDFLKTLPRPLLREGLVEVIKKAAVLDASFFEELEKNIESFFEVGKNLEKVIKRACEIKLAVIKEDFEEKKGKRRLLNYGHTVAHALEKFFDYNLSHGEAVAYGMMAESYLSSEMNLLSRLEMARLVKLLRLFIQPRTFDAEKVYQYMSLDKKNHEGLPHFVLLNQIGQAQDYNGEYCTRVEKELVMSALQFIQDL